MRASLGKRRSSFLLPPPPLLRRAPRLPKRVSERESYTLHILPLFLSLQCISALPSPLHTIRPGQSYLFFLLFLPSLSLSKQCFRMKIHVSKKKIRIYIDIYIACSFPLATFVFSKQSRKEERDFLLNRFMGRGRLEGSIRWGRFVSTKKQSHDARRTRSTATGQPTSRPVGPVYPSVRAESLIGKWAERGVAIGAVWFIHCGR